ncbi:nicotinate-nucleotide pyrophosphorylase [carboxylating] [Malonomonas rubra DSM 5091]|uniref:Probable nicotinate-nucleotide pyrophosphorylase [carboxylating] n=1 Tax=Malonomonas rubra DSM 5091 TaxID=1122189 RepID=A0A1M6NL92_MALRU|nr:carboxylating nicotinate-nucleotide diphosphorylase [Malonomonas rubra]SHJ96511.1 nicotinate-nucleotide pyrophosphorylase [carboxylating] [Malonomonas rubra DSM 5091]
MQFEIERIVRTALEEDIGLGDITTEVTVVADTVARAQLVAKEDFTLAGMNVAEAVFKTLDSTIGFEKLLEDGRPVKRGEVLAWIRGTAPVLLQGERTALNLMQRMSGIATLTAQYVEKVKGTKATIVDTRKTVPGLRALDKYAVRMGGGRNHRIGLFDGVLIKENHSAAAGGITAAVTRAKQKLPHTLKIEVETRNMEEVQEALTAGADIIMLDNMSYDEMRRGVELIAGKALVEASGGVSLDTVRDIAETGVDIISVGALTHSVKAADISMLLDD